MFTESLSPVPELACVAVQLTDAVSSNANAVIGETPSTSADGAAA